MPEVSTIEDSTPTRPRSNRVTLTKASLASQEGMDLLILCETVTADGSVSNDEVKLLQKWLLRNQGSTPPAVEFLTATVERIVEDGRITPQERDDLHIALERVMPPEQRAESRLRKLEREQRNLKDAEERSTQRQARRELATAEKAARRAAREQEQREEALRGERALIDIEFSVAGVTHEGRNATIREFAKEGDNVFLVRERTNAYSPHAIGVVLGNGRSIGYVPEAYASQWARFLDCGHRHLAYIKFIHSPEWNSDLSIPIIEGGIFVAESQFPGAVTESEALAVRARHLSGSSSPRVPKSDPNYLTGSNPQLDRKSDEKIGHGIDHVSDANVRRLMIAATVLFALIVIAVWGGNS